MPNAHQDRTRHGFEAPAFTMRPCPNCGAKSHGSSSGKTFDTIHCTCGTCQHQWVQESDQRIAAALAMQGAAA